MKISEFNNFLRLAKKREPIFRDGLAAANDMMREEFQDDASHTEPAIGHPPTLLPSPPPDLKAPGSIASIMSGSEYDVGAGDACSGPDLDTLLDFSFRQAREGQQLNNIVGQYDLWPSTQPDDPNSATNYQVGLASSETRDGHVVTRCYLSTISSVGNWPYDIMKHMVVC